MGTVNARREGMRFLSPLIHGFIDIAVVLAFLAAPVLLDFHAVPRIACYVIAAVHLVMTLLTAFPVGIVKIIPFTVHGAIEAVVAPTLVVLPWILGFSNVPGARTFYVLSGVAVAIVWATTNYRAAPSPSQTRRIEAH